MALTSPDFGSLRVVRLIAWHRAPKVSVAVIDQGGSCMVFYEGLVNYIESLLYSVSFKQQIHPGLRRQIVGPTS